MFQCITLLILYITLYDILEYIVRRVLIDYIRNFSFILASMYYNKIDGTDDILDQYYCRNLLARILVLA